MRREDLLAARAEAKRFLDRSNELLAHMVNNDEGYHQGSHMSGATRRASLDLTRSLATMRNRSRYR